MKSKNANKPNHPGWKIRIGMNPHYKLATAFSLIELMISLIVVSCITAAFTPVITKKLKSGSLIAGNIGDAFRNMKMGVADCKEFAGIDNCSFCDIKKKECKVCQFPKEKVCDTPKQYERTVDCQCINCSTVIEDCYFCTEKRCEACIAGKYLSDGICKPVNAPKQYTDPDNGVITPADCPDGSICPNGIKTDCTTAELTHKLCKDGVAVTCPDGSICNNGIETKCDSSNSSADNYTHKLCKYGTSTTCPEGSTCTNGIETKCTGKPANTWCINGTTQTCPEGNTCSNGIHTSCNGKPVSIRCINGVQTNCPEGYTCSNGVATPCTGVAHTVRCINGTTTNCTAGYWCTNGIQPSSKCKTDCENCSGASTCIGCGANQYLSGGNCTNCPSSATCNGSSFSCTSGFWSTGSSCAGCHSYCATCTAGGSTNCPSCKNGYWRSGTTCYTCPTHATCNGTSKTCHANWSGSSCSTYTPPCYWSKGGTRVDGPWSGWSMTAYSYCSSWNNYHSLTKFTYTSDGSFAAWKCWWTWYQGEYVGGCGGSTGVECMATTVSTDENTNPGYSACSSLGYTDSCKSYSYSYSWSGGPNQWTCN